MPGKTYKVFRDELEEFFELGKFAVEIYALRKKQSVDVYNAKGTRSIIGPYLKLGAKTYSQQVVSPYKNGLTVCFSADSINEFEEKYKAFLQEEDVKKHKELKHYSDMYDRLNKKLKGKFNIEEFICTKEKDENLKFAIANREFVETFEQSEWLCYTRHENVENAHIGRMKIKFDNFDEDDHCTVTIEHFINDLGPWKGEGSFDAIDKVLIIAVKNTTNYNRDYTHFLFKIESLLNELQLAVGAMSFRHKEFFNIVTKSVIITRFKGVEQPPFVRKFLFNDPDLDPSISDFFRVRELNRLASPKSPVHSLYTLKNWLKKNRPTDIDHCQPLEGTYQLYYKFHPEDKKYEKDELILSITEGSAVTAKYSHKYKNELPDTWTGSGFPSFETKILSLHLKGPEVVDTDLGSANLFDYKPTFLLIHLPRRGTQYIDTLSGTIAGYRDPETGSVARLFVMFKTTDNLNYQNADLKYELDKFFDYYKERSWVRPPSGISTFKDFQEVVNNSPVKAEKKTDNIY